MRIQQANWIDRARRAAGAKGPAQVELLEDIQQIIQVANLSLPEYHWLGGEKLMGGSGSVAAVVGQRPCFQLMNATNNVLCIVDYIELASTSAAGVVYNIDAGYVAADLGLAGAAVQSFDSRWYQGAPPFTANNAIRAELGTLVGNQITSLLERYFITGLAPAAHFDRTIVIKPGTGYVWELQLDNTQCLFNVRWRERPAESGELGLGT